MSDPIDLDAIRNIIDREKRKLACVRCEAEVSRSYEPGRCYADDCEPAEMPAHDEAEPWENVHGVQAKEKTLCPGAAITSAAARSVRDLGRPGRPLPPSPSPSGSYRSPLPPECQRPPHPRIPNPTTKASAASAQVRTERRTRARLGPARDEPKRLASLTVERSR